MKPQGQPLGSAPPPASVEGCVLGIHLPEGSIPQPASDLGCMAGAHRPSGSIPQPASERGCTAGAHCPKGSAPQPAFSVAPPQSEEKNAQRGSSTPAWLALGTRRKAAR